MSARGRERGDEVSLRRRRRERRYGRTLEVGHQLVERRLFLLQLALELLLLLDEVLERFSRVANGRLGGGTSVLVLRISTVQEGQQKEDSGKRRRMGEREGREEKRTSSSAFLSFVTFPSAAFFCTVSWTLAFSYAPSSLASAVAASSISCSLENDVKHQFPVSRGCGKEDIGKS